MKCRLKSKTKRIQFEFLLFFKIRHFSSLKKKKKNPASNSKDEAMHVRHGDWFGRCDHVTRLPVRPIDVSGKRPIGICTWCRNSCSRAHPIGCWLRRGGAGNEEEEEEEGPRGTCRVHQQTSRIIPSGGDWGEGGRRSGSGRETDSVNILAFRELSK